MPSACARRRADPCASLAVRWSESGCCMVLVAHDPPSAVGRLDMQFRSRAGFACHHSPAASWLGVAACELAPADGHQPPPTDLSAQAPLAICTGAKRASRWLTPRLADRTPGQGTGRGGHLRGRSTRRIRHQVPPSRSLTASTHSLVREGSPLGEDQPRRFPGQTWSGRSGHVQTEAPKSTSRPCTLAPSPPIVNRGRRPRHPEMQTKPMITTSSGN